MPRRARCLELDWIVWCSPGAIRTRKGQSNEGSRDGVACWSSNSRGTHDCQRRLWRLPAEIEVGDIGAGSGWSCQQCWWPDRCLKGREERRVEEREREIREKGRREEKNKVFRFFEFSKPEFILFSVFQNEISFLHISTRIFDI